MLNNAHKKSFKKGILLVTFGTRIPKAQAAFQNIEKKVRTAFPDVPVRWAYTSTIIRKKLAKEGTSLDSVETALAKMMDQGFTHVAVQSLHIIAGFEFHNVRKNADSFKNMAGGFQQIIVGYPLLGDAEDLSRITDLVIKHLPKERIKKDAVILMGHGTRHPANAFYEAMMYRLQRRDPNLYMGTVGRTPAIEDIKAMVMEKRIQKAYLIPFMTVAGNHAKNDLAGDAPDSWKSILSKAGIKCVPLLKGLAEYDEFVDIWVDHLKIVMKHFK